VISRFYSRNQEILSQIKDTYYLSRLPFTSQSSCLFLYTKQKKKYIILIGKFNYDVRGRRDKFSLCQYTAIPFNLQERLDLDSKLDIEHTVIPAKQQYLQSF
jgi:hypothetical protein